MANKKTIQQVDADIERWMQKLNTATRKLTELHKLRRKIVTGKVRSPLPEKANPGIKVTIRGGAAEPGLDDRVDDLYPKHVIPSGYGGGLIG